MSTTEPWSIGVLFSQSGHLANIERTQLMGTLVAIEEINEGGGICGRPIVPVCYDPASDLSQYRHFAHKLLTQDGISSILGCYTSSSRRALLPIVERLNGLLWYPTLYEGFEFSPNIIYSGSSPSQNSVALADYISSNIGDRVYFVGSDYIFPQESNRVLRHLLEAHGCKIVGERYVPIQARTEDFLPVMHDLRRCQPDAIFSTVVGDSTTLFYRLLRRTASAGRDIPIFSLTTTESEIQAMGRDAAEGHYTVASYFQTIESQANRAFVQRVQRRYGGDAPTNACMEAAYYQVHLLKAALEMVETMESDLLRIAALGSHYAAPQGTINIDSRWGHGNVWSRIGRVNPKGEFDIVAQSMSALDTDPFFERAAQAV